jgi:excisionase family DNA binding protein
VAEKSGLSDMSELLLSPFSKKNTPLTTQEVAQITGYHPRTIMRKARMGQIPGAVQIGGKGEGWRFKRKEFEAWWQQQGAL